MMTNLNNLFNKRFTIVDQSHDYSLPEPSSLFKGGTWEIEKLQNLKAELNEVKNRLNNYNLDKWHAHTSSTNSAREAMRRIKRNVQPEFVTQAWCKFYEIVSTYPLVPLDLINSTNKCFNSVHLCEAPGAFITSLNHWLKINTEGIDWDWSASTLNPYYEGNNLSAMIDDDRFIRYTLGNWYFGKDYTGNLMNLENMDHLVYMIEPDDNFLLITADGSIDCLDAPGEQETMVAQLHFCETITAMHMLAKGGSFLLKIFTIFECHTICLIYLLSCCFGKVNLIKPITSKEGNSECYVVCMDFKGLENKSQYLEVFRKYYETGLTEAMFQKDDIPKAFIKKIVKCSTFFKTQQCQVIMKNIESFEMSDNKDTMKAIQKMQKKVADKYFKMCKLRRIVDGEIIGRTQLGQTSGYINVRYQVFQDSYNDRCEKKTLAPEETLRELFRRSENIESDIQSSYSVTFEPYNLERGMEFSMGKIFHKIYNSRFCSVEALKLQTTIDDIIAKLGYTVEFPSKDNAAQSENCIAFKYTDPYDTVKIVTLLCDKLQSIKNGESISLIGFSLLTNFNVSLLYLIGGMFTSVEFQTHPDFGSIIHLKDYNYNEKLMKTLETIKRISCDAPNIKQQRCMVVILQPVFLYESDIYPTIVKINNSVLKAYIEHVMHIVEDS